MDANARLTSGIQIVTTLFATFGAILGDILPSQIEHKSYIYGIAQLSCLLVFFLIKIVLNKSSKKVENRLWRRFSLIMVLLFFVSSYLYYNHSRDFLKDKKGLSEKVVTGKLTKDALEMCQNADFKSENILKLPCEEALLDVYTEKDFHSIWEPNSVKNNEDLFVLFYILIIISLSAALFSLIELFPMKQDETE